MLWDEFYSKLSVRAKKALTRRGVNSFRELEKMNEYELGLIPGCGEGTAREIAGAFCAAGWKFLEPAKPEACQAAESAMDVLQEAISEAKRLRESMERVRMVLPLRDILAGFALAGIIAANKRVFDPGNDTSDAYMYADAMLNERKAGG